MNQIMAMSGASLSDCSLYRYHLWRIWDGAADHCMFIGLIPSTADATNDDPIIRVCINYARSWGFGGIYMLNLFAWKAAKPNDMLKASDPVGPQNDDILGQYSRRAALTVACWGNHGKHLGRSEAVRKLIPNLHYLKLNKSGEPHHPLYLKADLEPKLWE